MLYHRKIRKCISIIMFSILILSLTENVYASINISQGNNNIILNAEKIKNAVQVIKREEEFLNPNIVKDISMESGQKVTYDCIWFGSYPQTEVVLKGSKEENALKKMNTFYKTDYKSIDINEFSLIKNAQYDYKGDAWVNGVKYRRLKGEDALYRGDEVYDNGSYIWEGDYSTYHYFRYEPIKWRILQVNDNDVFLLSDVVLDAQKYNLEWESVTWETSTIRSWLNGYNGDCNKLNVNYSGNSFFDNAFTSAEKAMIKTTEVKNTDNLYWGTDGGNDTQDKIFLLSDEETYGEKSLTYGFVNDLGIWDEARRSLSSTFSFAMGISREGRPDFSDYSGLCSWWLRSPEEDQNNVSVILDYGDGSEVDSPVNRSCGIRPAIHLNFSDNNLYSSAGTVCSDGTINSEDGYEKDIFNMSIYRADHLLDTSHPTHSNLEAYISMDTPSNKFVTELQKNGFEAWENAWTSLTTTFDTLDAPSSLPEFVVEQKDVYSAIILEVLEVSTEYGMVDVFEDALGDCPSYVAEIVDILKLKYDIDIAESYDFKNMSSKQQDIVKGVCEDYFNNYLEKDVVQVDSVFSKIGTALDVADCIETYVEYISSAIALTQMSDALKTVLHTMTEKVPSSNLFLTWALDDCVEIIDSSTAELLDKFIEKKNFMIVGESAKYLVDKLWDVVKDAVNVDWPYLDAILVGYKAGKLISNSLFSTDETIEKYCIMLAVLDVRNLMDQTYQTLERTYQKEKNTENAEAYLSAVDVIFTIIDKDCESAYNFVDVLDKALATRIDELLNGEGDDPWQRNKNSIANIQMSFYDVHEQMLRNWIIYLKEDYPDQPELYDKYQSLREESMNRVLNKKYLAACPVDVYVYDLDNNLVAYVKDNKAYSNGEVTVVVENDTKALYFYNDDEYRIEYVGNGSGDMDLTVTEYGDDEKELRKVYFYDVPLTDGQTYETEVDARILDDTSYKLEEDSKKIEPDLDTNHADVNKKKVKINFGYMMVDEESVFETEAYPDEQVDIYAYIPEGYEFIKWISNAGTNIFADSSARITTLRMPNQDVTVTAELKKEKEDAHNPGGNVTPPTGNTGTSSPVSGNTGSTGQSQIGPVQNTNGRVLPVGTMLTDSRTNACYVVTEAGQSVAYVKNLNKKSISAIVPSNITFGNITYKVTSITANAFSGCKKLKSVTIGNNVTTIGNNAFKKCTSLKKVIIPARVTTIGKNAFAGCKKLKNVIVKTKVLKKIGKNAFKGINKAAKIKVPKKKLTAYKKLFKKAKLAKSIKITR